MRIDRLIAYADAHPQDIPPLGYERKRVRYLLRTDQHGCNPSMIDLATEDEKRGKAIFAPVRGRPAGDVPLLLCDHAEYVLGIPSNKSVEQARKRYWSHVELVRECVQETDEPAVNAALAFFTKNEPGRPSFELPEDFDPSSSIAFEVVSGWESILPIDVSSVHNFWAHVASEADEDTMIECLGCGQIRPVVRNQPVAIKGLPGGNPSGSKFISADNSCYESYRLERARVAPMCEQCAHKMGSALNLLLSDERTHIRTPSLKWIFWSESPTDFTWNIIEKPDPSQVKAFLRSVERGQETFLDDTAFYTAALQGKRGRMAVRDWHEETLGEAKRNIANYFNTMHLIDSNGEDRWFPHWLLARSTINTSPNSHEVPLAQVEEALLSHAFHGGPLPTWLLQRTLHRIAVERAPRASQIALLKMSVISQMEGGKENELQPSLNLTSTDKAYLCGRLLATLEEIHEAAIPGVGKNMTDRLYTRASVAPAFAFGVMMQRTMPHLTKLERDKPGAHVRLSKQLQEIMDHFEDPVFPQTFSVEEQARFAIGYWQQKSASIRAAIAAKAAKDANSSLTGDTADPTMLHMSLPTITTTEEDL